MKKLLRICHISLGLVTLFFPVTKVFAQKVFAQDIKISFDQYRLPVLPGKERNPVAGLTVTHMSNETIDLTTLRLKIISSGKGMITSVSLLSLGQDSAAAADTKMAKAIEVGRSPGKSDGSAEINGRVSLKNGKNYFLITVSVSQQSSLYDSIQVLATQAVFGKRSMNITAPSRITWQRIATSVRRAGEE
ncbi:BNR-repeat neuraminidase N-terminal domain-containing protein, partial [Flavitalea sp.]|nr:BNR-repeat neuraminidase N-terminal domain-containing protein [Flavitalea sp.]